MGERLGCFKRCFFGVSFTLLDFACIFTCFLGYNCVYVLLFLVDEFAFTASMCSVELKTVFSSPLTRAHFE